MSTGIRLDPSRVRAIDTHVHLESLAATGTQTDSDARKYFGESSAPRDAEGLAALLPIAQHRLRGVLGRRAAVGTPAGSQRRGRRVRRRSIRISRLPLPASIRRAARKGVREARRLVVVRAGPRPQAPSADAAVLSQRSHRLSAVRGVRGGRPARALPHRAQRHRHRHHPAAAASG